MPRGGSLRLGASKQISEEDVQRRRLSMKSRGTLDKKEKKLQGQMKDLMKEWKDVQHAKESLEIKEGSAAEDEWDSPRPDVQPTQR